MKADQIVNNILGCVPRKDNKSKNQEESVDYYFKKVKGHTGLGYYMCESLEEIGSLNSKYIGSSINDVKSFIDRNNIESYKIL